jgi:hypothetical protein
MVWLQRGGDAPAVLADSGQCKVNISRRVIASMKDRCDAANDNEIDACVM